MNRRITCLVMCSLLSVFLFGCQKDNPYPEGSRAYIDTNGEVVSEIYTNDVFIGCFDDRGYAEIQIQNGSKQYYIDKDFNIVGEGIFEPTQCVLYQYKEKDYFYVSKDNGVDIYDEDLNLVLNMCDIEYLRPIGANGLLGAKKTDGDKWGYIDLEGNRVIDYLYDDVGEFTDDGVAKVKADNGLWGVINEKGDYIIEPKYSYISDFSCGRAMAKESDKGFEKLIDFEGNEVSEKTYDSICFSYCDGLACVENPETHLYGYIDLDGNYVIEPKYTSAYDFINGYARVKNGKEYLVIDKQGNPLVVDGVKACGCPSKEGLFPAMKGELYGYYSLNTHKWVIKPQFPIGEYIPLEFYSGYAVVNLN